MLIDLVGFIQLRIVVVIIDVNMKQYTQDCPIVSGKTVAQVALRWLVQQKVVSSVIIGATSVQQLEDNMGAGSGWAITDEEVKCIFFVMTSSLIIHITAAYSFDCNYDDNKTLHITTISSTVAMTVTTMMMMTTTIMRIKMTRTITMTTTMMMMMMIIPVMTMVINITVIIKMMKYYLDDDI